MKILPYLFTAFFIVVGLSTAQAQFVGDFALTPPSANIYSANTTVGNWTYTVMNTGGNGQISTVSAPANFTLSASGFGAGLGSTSTLEYPSVPVDGTLAFDYIVNLGGSGGGASATVTFGHSADTPITLTSSGSGSVSWNILAGESIEFSAFAMGGMTISAGGAGGVGGVGGVGGPPGGPGAGGGVTPVLGSASASISNFSFIPASVPEPSDFALGGGLLAIGAACWRRWRN
jgi:hypothetical protein